MNRYIFLFLIAAFSLILHAKCVAQKNIVYGAGITYTVGVPTFVPPGNSSRVAIDTVTSKWYEYATPGGWRWSGDRVQDISGCAAPAYTPGKAQSRLVLNSCTEAQNGHGPELYKYTGSAWLCLNCGGNYTAGTGISISGGVITNTGDLSNTNELQTLSISNDTLSISDGNSVVLPGGGVTWPLLAPNGTALSPSYSFENDTLSGMYLGTKGLTIQGSVINVKAFAADDGGSFLMSSGEGLANAGGEFRLSAGNSSVSDGGQFNLNAGNSDVANGGQFSMAAGNGATGGAFTMNAGSSTGESNGGEFTINSGNSDLAGGGSLYINCGTGPVNGGSAFITGGNTDGDGGDITITGGESYSTGVGGDVAIYAGAGSIAGNVLLYGGSGGQAREGAVILGTRARFISYTSTDRNAIIEIQAGDTVFCSDCTANDSSTGVLQTYNGSAWKNHW